MHEFCGLIQHTTAFTLDALETAWQVARDELQSTAETRLVKVLQMVQLQKAISAVGMFAMFEAELQERLQLRDGFAEANQL